MNFVNLEPGGVVAKFVEEVYISASSFLCHRAHGRYYFVAQYLELDVSGEAVGGYAHGSGRCEPYGRF